MKRLPIALLLFLILVGSALAFPGIQRESAGQTFTIAGEKRVCSDYQDEKGTFTGTKVVTSKVMPALINLYACKNNDPECDQGWTYLGEYEAPRTFNYPGKYMAWDVYYCPETTAACQNGDQRIVTEKAYQVCKNGAWGPTVQCGALQYYDPEEQSCTITLCKEAWTCTAWGDCTSGGNQYRSCEDTNKCGTYKDAKKQQQPCTPTASDGPATPSAWKQNPPLVLVGSPSIDGNTYNPKAGDTITVRQKFQVNTPGNYWVEAGLDQTRTFSIADVTQNTCDPAETWYKNEKEAFTSTGIVKKTFTLTVPNNGEYVLHTAIVTACDGEVLDQQNQVERVIAGAPKDSNGGGMIASVLGGFLLFVVIIGSVIGIIALGFWAFKKR